MASTLSPTISRTAVGVVSRITRFSKSNVVSPRWISYRSPLAVEMINSPHCSRCFFTPSIFTAMPPPCPVSLPCIAAPRRLQETTANAQLPEASFLSFEGRISLSPTPPPRRLQPLMTFSSHSHGIVAAREFAIRRRSRLRPGLLVDLAALPAELLGFLPHSLLHGLLQREATGCGVLPDVLRDPHAAELRPAHGAEVRRFGRLSGERLVVVRHRSVRIEREAELVSPAEVEGRACRGVTPLLRRRMAFRKGAGVGRDLVGDHAFLHVVFVRSAEVLLGGYIT